MASLLGMTSQSMAQQCSLTAIGSRCMAPIHPDSRSGRCLWHDPSIDKSSLALAQLWAEQGSLVLMHGLQLQDAFFEGAEMIGFSCTACNMQRATFSGTTIETAVWTDSNLTATNFVSAVLDDIAIIKTDMLRADLSLATIRNTNFQNVNLSKAQLDQATFQSTSFQDIDLSDASLIKTNLSRNDLLDVRFDRANMTSADLSQTDLTRVSFVDTDLMGAIFGGARPAMLKWSPEAIFPRERTANPELESGRGQLKEAELIYRELRLMYSGAGDSDTAGMFFFRENEAKRKAAQGSERAFHEAVRFAVGYGERPWYLIRLGGIIIGICGLLFALAGLEDEDGEPVSLGQMQGFGAKVIFVLNCMYFSGVTFTTLGYGDYKPKGLSRAVAVTEALLGIVTVSLFLFNFGRYLAR